jgi:D-serine deaminase-like pyridoxal phosphate-dependent protein
MLATCEAPDVLFAYQPFGPKLSRFISLIKSYPTTQFSCLVDNLSSAIAVAQAAEASSITIPVYIDINAGMNRTGIAIQEAEELYDECCKHGGIQAIGLHLYDGHIGHVVMEERIAACNKSFQPVEDLQTRLVNKGYQPPIIVAGGSPTFHIHAKRPNVECSPGTFIYWDRGYSLSYPEQEFLISGEWQNISRDRKITI